jgi:prepilin-type N-terminal cleavage/methylation domain-containing protein
MKQTGWWWKECRRRGFTVIEMVMVCVLIGLVAGIAIPKFDINRYRGDGAARVIRVLLQEAERNAITRQSNVIVSFDMTYNRLRIVQDYNNNDTINVTDVVQYRKLPEGAHFATPSWPGINGTTVSSAITGAGMQTVSGMTSVIFRRDGSASSDIEMYVTNRDGVKTDYRGFLVTGSTGRSDWYTWNGQAWMRKSQ